MADVIVKPRLHERVFARDDDAIFSNFVASPGRDENHTRSHPCTGDATGELKIARKKSPELELQHFARACDATKEYLADKIKGGINNVVPRSLEVCDSRGLKCVTKI